jgi:hypothetical protein
VYPTRKSRARCLSLQAVILVLPVSVLLVTVFRNVVQVGDVVRLCLREVELQARRRRATLAATATKPVPNSSIVAGSGTADGDCKPK